MSSVSESAAALSAWMCESDQNMAWASERRPVAVVGLASSSGLGDSVVEGLARMLYRWWTERDQYEPLPPVVVRLLAAVEAES